MQLHHPRFLEFIGRRSLLDCCIVSRHFGWLVDGRGRCCSGRYQLAAACQSDVVEPPHTFSVCDIATLDVNRDARSEDGLCGVPFTRGRGSVSNAAGAPCAPCAPGGTVHGRDGIVASSDGSGRSRACSGSILQFVHELSVLLPEEAGFFRQVTRRLLVMHERYGSVIHNRGPDFMNV